MPNNLFGKPQSKLDKIVDGLTNKAVDGSTLSDVKHELQKLNNYFQSNTNVENQVESYYKFFGVGFSTIGGILDELVPQKQGWQFKLFVLYIHDNSSPPTGNGLISICSGVVTVNNIYERPLFYFNSNTYQTAQYLPLSEPLLLPIGAGLYSIGLTTTVVIIHGQYEKVQ